MLTSPSINSIDALLESDEFNEQTTDVQKQVLEECTTSLLERKGSSYHSREENLTTYVRCLTAHHLADVLYGRVPDLLSAFGKSIKAETSVKETTLALRAVSLTAISYAEETLYESIVALLKRTISDSQSNHVKAAAIDCISICISFGGGGEEEILELLTFLLEVVSSDGSFINADDSSEVVTAALNNYGFLATQVDDLESESEDAVAAFLEQLDSSYVKVQIAAGENIALLYEKSHLPMDDADSSSDEDDDDSDEEVNASMKRGYNAYHNTREVLDKVTALSSLSTKTIGRRDKKTLHQTFASIAMTVEKPQMGLQTNNASKMIVRIHNEGEMRVDKWWKLTRLNAIRRLLAGGFVNHYFEGNKQVLDALPLIMRDTSVGMRSPRRSMPSKATKGKFRDSRRFVSGELEEL
jgi:Interferon-related developmental regulator (IFRD)